ncbi:MAG: putative porin [Cytophagales bacterium]|nr:putative porin [Cytophagales bacterium]
MKKALLLFLLFAEHLVLGQFVDDSTKNVYSASTTFFTTERFIKNNLPNPYQNPDTTVYLDEKYSRVDASNRELQHLGFLGSAILDNRFETDSEPGRTFGFNGYDPYFRSIDDIKYYDTKSPFMDVGVVFGGENRSKIDFGFSRNVNENWNLGFDINRITADKQIAKTGVGDRATESVSFDFYSHYEHKKVPYEVAFSFLSLKHEVAEIGGVFVEEDATRADFYLYQDATTQLQDATTRDQRSRFHIYHQYNLGSGFQIYHQLDRTNQEFDFVDFAETDTTKYYAFYPMFNIDNDTTRENGIYSSTVNEAGLKGDIRGAFYRFYVKQRSLIYNTKFTIEEAVGETYLGTYLRFNWQDKFVVTGIGELSNEGFYKLKGELASDLISVSYSSLRASPSFQALNYEGNHHNWENSFRPIFTNTIRGQLNLQKGGISISPKVSVTTINNYVYIDAAQVIAQTSDALLITKVGGSINFEFLRGLFRKNENEAFRFENEVVINSVSKKEEKFIKVPAVQYNGRFFWRGLWFENAVPVEVGTDFYFRSSFRGKSFDPVISQFYLQDEIRLRNYFAVDIFVNMKIRNLTTFIKWTHINQQSNDGYLASPFYPGQKAITDFGVRWLFFD